MTSIRKRLLTSTLVGSCALAITVGLGFYYAIRSILSTDFDETLIAKARAMAALVEEEDGEIEAEFASYPSTEFTRKERPEYYLLRNSLGEAFARSPSLTSFGLDERTPLMSLVRDGRTPLDGHVIETGDINLPDGMPGRYAAIRFQARTEGRHRPTQQLVLVVAKDVLDLKHTLHQLRLTLLGLGGTAVLGLCGLIVIAIRSGLTPLKSMATHIDQLDAGDLAQRLPIHNAPAELVPVVTCLNNLLARLETAFERERAFTADVAHDLRTPLAGLRSTLEVALSRDRGPVEYRDTLAESLAITHDMQTMTGNLLALARAEAGQLKIQREPVDLQHLVRGAWKPFETAAAARNLRVAMIVPAGMQISTDRGQLSLVLNQLFENAVTYADAGGEIRIEAHATDHGVRIQASNTGNELTSEDAAHVFERFWRGDKSRSRPGLHCGLGLSLAKRITELLGGTIRAAVDGQWFGISVELKQ